MKMSPGTVILIAVVSSIVTVLSLELFRESRPASSPALATAPTLESSRVHVPATAEPLVPVKSAADAPKNAPAARSTNFDDRLIRLEQRLDALDLESNASRTPVPSSQSGLPPTDDLRKQVFDWMAEEHESRVRVEEVEEERHQREEMEFEARFSAHMLAQEHDLSDWEENQIIELFLEIEQRNREIEEDIDLLTDDPAEVEARWDAFDEWADQLYLEMLGQELIDEVFGDEYDENEEGEQ